MKNKKHLSKITIVIIIVVTYIAFQFGLSYILDKNIVETIFSKSTESEAIKYISEKYDKKFIPISYDKYDNIVTCYEENTEFIEDECVRIYEGNGFWNNTFHDNYYGYYIRPKIENYISNMVSSEFEEFKVYNTPEISALPDELDSDCSLEDLFRIHPNYWMTIKIFVKGDPLMSQYEYEEKTSNIERKLIDSKHTYSVHIFALSEDTYNSFNRISQNDFWRFYASNKEPDGVKYYYDYNVIISDGKVL